MNLGIFMKMIVGIDAALGACYTCLGRDVRIKQNRGAWDHWEFSRGADC